MAVRSGPITRRNTLDRSGGRGYFGGAWWGEVGKDGIPRHERTAQRSMAGTRSPIRGGKFLGSFQHQLDDKGRLSLPAQFRREATEQRFVLVQAYAPSLALYPETEWLEVEERMGDMMRDPAGRMWVLSVMSNAVEVSPDAQGRILIPAALRSAAELEGQALLVGAINKVEIWNPAKFEAAVQSATPDFDRFAANIFR
jgi:MraZ protein